ncbi:hypothetical protein [Terriglobus aquaticus]|uniref:Lipoprotein n=1 Tax=Terriglobus aquaticus TaxID=940139 RepID=A0ABW9KNG7_9BACT|nr:hypothetical protein [Terriglobus aquaticus]
MKRLGAWDRRRRALVFLPMLLLLCLQGCRTQEDAVAAAEQMAVTSQAMRGYYAALERLTEKTVEVRRAQRMLLHGPPDPASDERLAVRRAELIKREALARDVTRLAQLFGEIANSDAASEAAKSAEQLRQDAVGLQLIADNTEVQKGLQVAVTSLVNGLRARDERKAARSLQPVLVALCSFFDSEKAAYEAVTTDFYTGAAANAVALIEADQVSVAGEYRSSLQPFGLEPEITTPALKMAGREDLEAQVNRRLARLTQGSVDATEAMSEALRRVAARVDTVAKGGPMRVRIPPLQVDTVKAWVAELQTLSGASL